MRDQEEAVFSLPAVRAHSAVAIAAASILLEDAHRLLGHLIITNIY